METTTVSGVFDSLQTAWKTIQLLRAARLPQDKVSVVGPDSDRFWAMSRKLESRQRGSYIFIYGCVGMMLGTLLALYAILTSPVDGFAVTLGPLFTLLLGAILGNMSGTLTGALIHCDSAQNDVQTERAKAADGKLVISICVRNAIEQRRVEALLMEGGAAEIRIATTKAVCQTSTGVKTGKVSVLHTQGR